MKSLRHTRVHNGELSQHMVPGVKICGVLRCILSEYVYLQVGFKKCVFIMLARNILSREIYVLETVLFKIYICSCYLSHYNVSAERELHAVYALPVGIPFNLFKFVL